MTYKAVCEHTGIITVYTYGEDKSRGVICVELEYPGDYIKELRGKERSNSNLPKYKQRFVNPKTGREVSYLRAKHLGIV
jgi:hypothetical protein